MTLATRIAALWRRIVPDRDDRRFTIPPPDLLQPEADYYPPREGS